jgi:hypothetical protein
MIRTIIDASASVYTISLRENIARRLRLETRIDEGHALASAERAVSEIVRTAPYQRLMANALEDYGVKLGTAMIHSSNPVLNSRTPALPN